MNLGKEWISKKSHETTMLCWFCLLEHVSSNVQNLRLLDVPQMQSSNTVVEMESKFRVECKLTFETPKVMNRYLTAVLAAAAATVPVLVVGGYILSVRRGSTIVTVKVCSPKYHISQIFGNFHNRAALWMLKSYSLFFSLYAISQMNGCRNDIICLLQAEF